MTSFAAKVALVTGTTGIGRAIALRFAADGAQVVAAGIDEKANAELNALSRQRGLPLFAERCDVSDAASVQALVAATIRRCGGVDILVNAAGIHPFGNVVETEPEIWNRCFAINVGSVYLLARAVIPEMKKRGGGCILNLASVQGYACQKGVVAYAASKGAVHSLTRALALDHAADRIRVNSISPGSVATPMLATSAQHFAPGIPTDQVFARFGAAHPLGRVGTPEEIAAVAAFLASDEAAFCTGSDILVDGGLLAGIGVS
ncbi:MAG TPA: SDR family oxidoreductase [Acidobacteriaceae bacterium]|jgi:NAD(P)-dependent dehydrogenase (short-subunit alcohol dehydrogenase family)|nr:SDR family oxidoreductase [Acidobacteriaceae bacterium]